MRIPGTLTAQELADLIGVTRWTIRRWQNEGRIPGPDLCSPGGRPLYSEPLARSIRGLILNPRQPSHRLRIALVDALDTAGIMDPRRRDTLAGQLVPLLLEDDRIAIL